MRKLSTSIAMLVVIALAFGCAGTSHGFKTATKALVPDIVKKMDVYQAADPNVTDDQRGAVRRLEATIAYDQGITVDSVEAVWIPVQPMYRSYITADPKLANDPATRQDRLKSCDLMNKAITEERKRQSLWFGLGGSSE